jgi:RNA polymerase sigma factor (sigma-70 family)
LDTAADAYALIAPVERRMVNAIWRIVRDADGTEDVLQQVLTRVVARPGRLRSHPNPTALLLRMCTSAAVDWLRHKRRHSQATHPTANPDSAPAPSPGPDESFLQRETCDRLLSGLRDLPAREAEAIALLALEGMAYAEIAAAMGCAESTVRVLVTRARKRLRAKYTTMGILSPEVQP